ncbi:tripartite motif-containing protein 16 isoform X4 [Dicentrarchus labrax]|uniref:tripartite motif-containing protein 16 isoform X4 n=1 Tax=Dicentrarchus labrax TaxID=13489 RepID=UPI0021F53171|nr:tripartite motif-containing protein 16 isoform X4 [Dicentrarchus labrax]
MQTDNPSLFSNTELNSDFIFPDSRPFHRSASVEMGVTNMLGRARGTNHFNADQHSCVTLVIAVRKVKLLSHSLLLRGEMAQQGNQTHEVKFCCSICLDLLKDPVTIPCGHNYCINCIKTHWDEEDQKKIHSCPQCRKTFIPRPVLVKNNMLAELVEEVKKIGLQAAPADHCYAGPGDVACDVCTGRKLKAFKSCLVCLASYCEQHLQPHYESPTFKKHKLVEASFKLQDTICSRHDEVMKIFCRTDQQCICIVCSMDEHKGHDTVSAATARTEKQKELSQSRQNIQQRIQVREKDVKELQKEVKTINHSADKAVAHSKKVFTELICVIEKRSSDVKQQIRSQQETEVSRVKELQEKLNQEIAELKRKDVELEQLFHTEDNTQFLHKYPSLSQLLESTDSPRPTISCLQCFEDVTAAVAKARDRIQAILCDEWMKTTEMDMDVLLSQPEPTTRAEFLQYSCQITLDPNTARKFLVLSEGNRKITYNDKNTPYSPHPDRFIGVSQVLSKDGLTGRCYWEVEMSKYAGVAVAYKSIRRSGDLNSYVFGYNENSWILHRRTGYLFRHDNHSASISGPKYSRIGVYLDHSAGILSFYSVSETMTLLHRVQTTFTQPLYAGLYLSGPNGDTVELCKLK